MNPLWSGYLLNIDKEVIFNCFKSFASPERIEEDQVAEMLERIRKRLSSIKDKNKMGAFISQITKTQDKDGYNFIVGVQVSNT